MGVGGGGVTSFGLRFRYFDDFYFPSVRSDPGWNPEYIRNPIATFCCARFHPVYRP